MDDARVPKGDRYDLWLPLLRSLTREVPEWAVWKNADSALHRQGDVDSAAPRRAWPAIGSAFVAWADDAELGATFACMHIPRTANFFSVLPGTTDLLQLEVKAGATFRGSVLFSADDVLALSIEDDRGFRRLRDGAEGVLKLVNNGMRRGGRPDHASIEEKGVLALLRADPPGVDAMAARCGTSERALRRGVEAVLAGGWDRRAMIEVEAWAMARAATQPHVIAERVWFRAVRKPTCPVLRTVYRRGRRAPEDVEGWLDEVEADHRVMRRG